MTIRANNNHAEPLAVVCPMANEALYAERFVLEVLDCCRNAGVPDVTMYVVIDRASTDGTLELLRKLALRCANLMVIYAPENRGVVDAYVRGYHEALESTVPWVLEIDAGYSHLPTEISRYLSQARQGVDCVFGTRFSKGGRFEGGLSKRYLVSRIGGLLARIVLGTKLSDMTSGFQLFRRESLSRILEQGLESRGPFFQTEIKYHARDLNVVEVPITYKPTVSTVRRGAIMDALKVLLKLFVARIRGIPTAHNTH